MSIKISELPVATSVNPTDIVPIVQGGTTKQANLGIVASAGGVPTNSIMQYDGDTIPAGYEEVNGFDNYSTTERVVGTWINGKPLYERVIEIAPQTFPANSVTGVQHNIANFEFGFVVNGGFYYTSGTTGLNTYMIGNYYANSTSYTQNAVFYISIVNINSTVIGVANSYTYSSTLVNGGFAVVRYTKTTDSAS